MTNEQIETLVEQYFGPGANVTRVGIGHQIYAYDNLTVDLQLPREKRGYSVSLVLEDGEGWADYGVREDLDALLLYIRQRLDAYLARFAEISRRLPVLRTEPELA